MNVEIATRDSNFGLVIHSYS